ncbi:unnamed protein product [Nyctereutes procyonoides]|uniref:(raccoon dog) hypothetical protein n=1 Tax=Nyctereutes procyonoides TaxID=34880 RepID=A0A811ZW30_NYCPR|nr:unnamed protein product [Nyctereutes procyonoides]
MLHGSPPHGSSRTAPPASQAPQMRAAPGPAPAAHPQTGAPPSAVGSPGTAPQQPGLVVQMATTAADLTVGSAPSRPDITYQEPRGTQPACQQQQFGPCHSEMKQFLECAQNQGDLKLCEGFSNVLSADLQVD